MRRDDLRAFARRDWRGIGHRRLAFWAERYRREGGVPARRASAQLYEHARRLHVPVTDDRRRADDHAHHVRLRELLDRAASALTRR